MKDRPIGLAILLLVAALLSAAASSLPAAASPALITPHYHLVRKIRLRGSGFWDYLTMDSVGRRLYITHNTHVTVLNPDTGKVIGTIANTLGVHCVALAPELGLGFTSNGGAASVTTFSLKTLKEIRVTRTTGKDPDALVYDPASRRVFTFNGDSGSSTVIDAANGKVIGTITLGGTPEFAVADGRGMIYNNLVDKGMLLEINTRTLRIVNRWPTACKEPTSMAMDHANRRLFIGCRDQHMQVVDADDGHLITSLPIGQTVDATRYDPGTKLAFASCGDGGGTLTVVREVTPDNFRVAENVRTEPDARTMAEDVRTHDIFLVTSKVGPPPAATPENPDPRDTIYPNTFVLLEYAP